MTKNDKIIMNGVVGMKVRNTQKKVIKQSTAVKALGIFSIIALVLMFVMQFVSMTQSNKFDKCIEKRDYLIENADKLFDTSGYLTKEIRAYAASGNSNNYQNYMNEININKNREKAIENVLTAGITVEEKNILDNMLKKSNELAVLEEKALRLISEGKHNQATAVLYGGEYMSKADEINMLVNQFYNLIETRMNNITSQQGLIIDVVTYIQFLCIVLVGVAQVLFIIYTTRNLLEPIIKLRNNLRLMGQGDFDTETGLLANDTEIGELVGTLNEIKQSTKEMVEDIGNIMAQFANGNFTSETSHESAYVGVYKPILLAMRGLKEKQADTLLQIQEAIEQVNCGASQVSDSSQGLAQGATEQSSSVGELTTAMQAMSNQVRSNASNAEFANKLVNEVGDMAILAKSDMSELTTAMNEISTASQNIKHVVKTIDDIAFNTNILALNAAVEAARAGEAGKGFAVVADEVSNLAGSSAQATKDTTRMIEEAIETVERGQSIMTKSVAGFEMLTEKVGQVVTAINEISEVLKEQAVRTQEVTDGIDQINSVTQTVAATSEESAAASEELSAQARLMFDLVKQFKFN